MREILRKLGADRRGAALVEFTLVAPLLISLMVGLAEFGCAFRQYAVMQKGVRDAGRYLSRAEGSPCPTTDGAWATSVSQAKALAITAKIDGDTPLHKAWTDPNTVAVAVSCIDNSTHVWRGGAWRAVVTVTARAPYRDLGMLSFLGLTAPTLTVAHEQLVIGS